MTMGYQRLRCIRFNSMFSSTRRLPPRPNRVLVGRLFQICFIILSVSHHFHVYHSLTNIISAINSYYFMHTRFNSYYFMHSRINPFHTYMKVSLYIVDKLCLASTLFGLLVFRNYPKWPTSEWTHKS